MTTIAYRDGIMAVDSMVIDRGTRVGAFSKIVRTKEGGTIRARTLRRANKKAT